MTNPSGRGNGAEGSARGPGRAEDLALAKEAALRAGMVLMSHFQRRVEGERGAEHKGAVDLVTEADKEAERTIVEILHARRAGDDVLTEETPRERPGRVGEPGAPRRLWIVDPLDGTTNFAHAVPHFAVSIALWEEGRPAVGVVYSPVAGELFEAVEGRGAGLATFGGGGSFRVAPIRVSHVPSLSDSLLATGFPYDRRESDDDNTAEHRVLLNASQGVRRFGAAALDLAWVAAGRFDGYWEMKLSPWDVAAGGLLVTEAGGRITGYGGEPFDPFVPFVVASNGRIHDEMIDLLSLTRSTRPGPHEY